MEKKTFYDPFNNFDLVQDEINLDNTPGNSIHNSACGDLSNISMSMLKRKGLISLFCMSEKKERNIYCLTTKGVVKAEELKESTDTNFEEGSSEQFTIGSSEKCNITIKEEGMSRQHLMLMVKGSNLFAQDLKSSNGSFRIIQKDEALQIDQIYRIGRKFLLKVKEIGVIADKVPAGVVSLVRIPGKDAVKYSAWIRLQLVRKVKDPINSFFYEEDPEDFTFGLEIEKDPNTIGRSIIIAREMSDISDGTLENTRARVFWSKERQKFMIQDMSQKDGELVWFSLSKFGENIKNDAFELQDKDRINIAGTLIRVMMQ